jgi:hypothetical protein
VPAGEDGWVGCCDDPTVLSDASSYSPSPSPSVCSRSALTKGGWVRGSWRRRVPTAEGGWC